MTVLEAIQKSTDFLGKKNIESPRLQTELLLAHLLKMPRMKLYLNFERALTTVETDALREFIKRRSQHEPLQHITGSTSFCGYEIAVNPHALVPRPETELLAELGWQFLLAAPGQGEGGSTINSQPSTCLDLCTGSGCIAIALAAKCPTAKIVATDISADALALAKENAARNNIAERIEFLQGDGFATLKDAPERGRPAREPIGRANTARRAACAPLISSSATRLTSRPPRSRPLSRRSAITIRALRWMAARTAWSFIV